MDNNELGTNLAEVGTDAISRQEAMDAFNTNIDELVVSGKENADAVEMYLNRVIDEIKQLPPIQPEIIRCKDCKWWDRYNDNNGYCMAAKSCTYTSHWDIQIRRTYDGDFYCAHAEPNEAKTDTGAQESEGV